MNENPSHGFLNLSLKEKSFPPWPQKSGNWSDLYIPLHAERQYSVVKIKGSKQKWKIKYTQTQKCKIEFDYTCIAWFQLPKKNSKATLSFSLIQWIDILQNFVDIWFSAMWFGVPKQILIYVTHLFKDLFPVMPLLKSQTRLLTPSSLPFILFHVHAAIIICVTAQHFFVHEFPLLYSMLCEERGPVVNLHC